MKSIVCASAVMALALFPSAAAYAAPARAALTPFEELEAGNHRYVAGKSIHPRIDAERRRATAVEGQRPIAAILGCADSRVPPEILFDQAFANLFVVRVAGNVAAPMEIASLEYAVLVLKVPLIVVLGHTKCGAVEAAVANKPLPGSLPGLVDMIKPAAEAASKEAGGKDKVLDAAIKENVYRQMSLLVSNSAIIRDAVKSKQLKLAGGIREIHDGDIDWLPERH